VIPFSLSRGENENLPTHTFQKRNPSSISPIKKKNPFTPRKLRLRDGEFARDQPQSVVLRLREKSPSTVIVYRAGCRSRKTQRRYSSARNCTRRNRSRLPSRGASLRAILCADECLLARPRYVRDDSRREEEACLRVKPTPVCKIGIDERSITTRAAGLAEMPIEIAARARSIVRRDYAIGNDYQSSHCVKINRAIVFLRYELLAL